MKVIAKKKKSIAWLYGILSVLGALSFILSSSINNDQVVFLGLFGVFLFAAGLVLFIQNVKIPNDIISVDESVGRIYLHPQDVSISALSISDVSYRESRLRYASFRWGTIIITTPNEVYEYHCVDNCEQVAKNLLRIIYSHKN